jgi:hypothetical protein
MNKPEPLTDGTVQRIAKMFPLTDQELVSAVLIEECGGDLCGDNLSTAGIERIRFAVLKLSGGDLNALQRAIDLANIDWRDVLVAAGFGNDVKAHLSWWPDAPLR